VPGTPPGGAGGGGIGTTQSAEATGYRSLDRESWGR